jgi:hypothetical protein
MDDLNFKKATRRTDEEMKDIQKKLIDALKTV